LGKRKGEMGGTSEMSILICFSCGKKLKIEDHYFIPGKPKRRLCPSCYDFWKNENIKKDNKGELEK